MMGRDAAQGELEVLLGHTFADDAFLRRALTHASATPAGVSHAATYQRLEFLGDRVLSLVIADALIRAFPGAEEGELAVRLNALVCADTLAEIAEEIALGSHAHWGAGEAKPGSRARAAILSDMMESVIAALYRDGGLEPARRFIEKVFDKRILASAQVQRDAKTRLQEWYQARGLATPVYEVVSRDGPDHAPVFVIEVHDGQGRKAQAKGSSKREAQQAAAALLLEHHETGENT